MNIGIIVYSQTGNTHFVAQKLKEKLAADGHRSGVERVQIAGKAAPGAKEFQFAVFPEVDKYDALVFGAPVHAFSLAPVMAAYLQQLSSLQSKKVACYVTKQLAFHWTGGNRAIAQMKKICQLKGGTVSGSAIVIWPKSGRGQKINDGVELLSSFFSI